MDCFLASSSFVNKAGELEIMAFFPRNHAVKRFKASSWAILVMT